MTIFVFGSNLAGIHGGGERYMLESIMGLFMVKVLDYRE